MKFKELKKQLKQIKANVFIITDHVIEGFANDAEKAIDMINETFEVDECTFHASIKNNKCIIEIE